MHIPHLIAMNMLYLTTIKALEDFCQSSFAVPSFYLFIITILKKPYISLLFIKTGDSYPLPFCLNGNTTQNINKIHHFDKAVT